MLQPMGILKSLARGGLQSLPVIYKCVGIVKDDGKAELRHILELHVRGYTSLVTAENTSCGAKCLLFVSSLLPTDENAVKHVSLVCVHNSWRLSPFLFCSNFTRVFKINMIPIWDSHL